MRKILVIVERNGGKVDETAYELLAAARSLSECQVSAVLLGTGVAEAAAELARCFDGVHLFEAPELDPPDGDLYARVLAPLMQREKPYATLLPHSNCGMDIAPALAVRAGTPLIADGLALELAEGDRLSVLRPVYADKVRARVTASPSAAGITLTLRPGSFTAAPEPSRTGSSCEIKAEAMPAGIAKRRRHVETVTPEAGDVDITQAEVLVAVGRGIDDEENIPMIESLAEAMGADIACTRPVADKKWLDKSRQVGTSGISVSPRVYLALGISGSFQHLGGLKGGPYLAAINKDPAAPIFSVADVGIVGDLLELVPLLEQKIRERKG